MTVEKVRDMDDKIERGMEDSSFTFSPRQRAQYEATEQIVEIFGKFDQTTGESGAHYGPVSPFVDEGLVCASCAFYEGPRSCEVVDGEIDPAGICKLWVIPADLLPGAAPAPVESMSASRGDAALLEKRHELRNVREVRQFTLSDVEVRENPTDGTINFVGYATVFDRDYSVTDQFGSYTERIAPGAFTRTLAEGPDVVLNLNHGAGGTGLPVARTKSGTLQLSQDSIGLRVSSTLDPTDPDVQAILPKMRRGDLDEMSMAFRVNAQDWSDDWSDRTITEINLARGDVSIVSFGANPATVAALRAEHLGDVVERADVVEPDLEDVTSAEPLADETDAAEEQPVDLEETERSSSVVEMLARLVESRRLV